MANALYDAGREGFLAGEIDWNSAVIRAALVRGYVTTNATTNHKFVSDVSAASGVIVQSQTLTAPTVTGGVADANDVTFTGISGTAIGTVIIYQASAVVPTFTTISTTGTVGTVTNQTATITGMSSTTGLSQGSLITATNGTGSLGTACYVTSVVSGTSVTVASTSGLTAGTVTTIQTNDVADTAKRLIAFVDQTSGVALPITPNGGDIIITWDNGANKIFKL